MINWLKIKWFWELLTWIIWILEKLEPFYAYRIWNSKLFFLLIFQYLQAFIKVKFSQFLFEFSQLKEVTLYTKNIIVRSNSVDFANGQSIEFKFLEVIFQFAEVLLWVYFLHNYAPKIHQNCRNPPRNPTNSQQFSCCLIGGFVSVVKYRRKTKSYYHHNQMIHDPLIAWYVTIVFLFFRRIQSHNLVNCWFLSPDLISSLSQHSKKGQY